MDRARAAELWREAWDEHRVATGIREAQTPRIDGSLQVMRGLSQMFPGIEADALDDDAAAWEAASLIHTTVIPKGQEAVRRVLEGQPGSPLTVVGMVKALGERGWLPDSEHPSAAVRSALERLIDAEPEHFMKFQTAVGVTYMHVTEDTIINHDPKTGDLIVEVPGERTARIAANQRGDA